MASPTRRAVSRTMSTTFSRFCARRLSIRAISRARDPRDREPRLLTLEANQRVRPTATPPALAPGREQTLRALVGTPTNPIPWPRAPVMRRAGRPFDLRPVATHRPYPCPRAPHVLGGVGPHLHLNPRASLALDELNRDLADRRVRERSPVGFGEGVGELQRGRSIDRCDLPDALCPVAVRAGHEVFDLTARTEVVLREGRRIASADPTTFELAGIRPKLPDLPMGASKSATVMVRLRRGRRRRG